jgi:trk system potassium uptake protein TrkA
MENLYNIIKGQVVAAEFVIGDRSPISDKPLKELNLKDDVLIAAILRDRAVIIPRGNDVITSGDSVVIVTKQTGLCDVTDILKK